MDTETLIESLTTDLTRSGRLAGPWLRATMWLAIAVPYVAGVVYLMSPRSDLASKFLDPQFVVEQMAALATGIAAAAAAFGTTIPSYSRKILIAPAVTLAIWLGALGQGCISSLLASGIERSTLSADWLCLPAIVLVGAVPAWTMVAMLRRGAPLAPYITVGLGGLAAAGLGNFGLRLFHPQDASLMVLVWQFGTVSLLSICAACVGPRFLNWDIVKGRQT